MFKEQSIIDESLDLNNKLQYKLSILLSENGLSFLVLDKKKQKIVAWEKYALEENLENQEIAFLVFKILKNSELKGGEYDSVNFIYASPNSVLVPSAFYQEKEKNSLFELSVKLEKEESVYANTIDVLDAVKLFSIPDCIYHTISKCFSGFQAVHHTTALLGLNQEQNKSGLALLYCSKSFFSISIYKQGKLLLDNAFRYVEKEDLLYYLLNTLNRLDLSPKTQKINLYSDVPKSDSTIKLLEDYLGGIEYANYPKDFLYNHQFVSSLSPYLGLHIQSFKCE